MSRSYGISNDFERDFRKRCRNASALPVRDDHPRGDIRQGHEDKGALPQPRVRHDKVGLVNGRVAKKQQIEVQGARPEATFPTHAPKGCFNVQKRGEEFSGCPVGGKPKRHDLVEKKRLVGIAPGFGFVNRACRRETCPGEHGQTLLGHFQGSRPISEIGAQPDIGGSDDMTFRGGVSFLAAAQK